MNLEPYLTWDESFSVQNDLLDSQHRTMFDLLNGLYDALNNGHTVDQAQALLEKARDYGKSHFRTEEVLMERCGHPGFAAHKEAHAAYIAQIQRIWARPDVEQDDRVLDLVLFLKEWWLKHVTEMDSEYAVALKEFLAAARLHS